MFRSEILPTRQAAASGFLLLLALYLTGRYDYLVFHSFVEVFTVVVAWGIFIVAWNSRNLVDNGYLLFLGIAYLFVGWLELLHMLSYKGMGVFSGPGANLATQLWIITRYIEAFSLIIAPLFITRKINAVAVAAVYTAVVALMLLCLFYWRVFPDCFIEGHGLTPFKKASEYAICILLSASLLTLWLKRSEFEPHIFAMLVTSIVLTVLSEVAFTFYTSVYGTSNMLGHLLRLISSYYIYKAFIRAGIGSPFNLIFRNLARSEKNLFSLLEKLPAFVFLQMRDYSIQFANRVFREKFGDPEGKRCYELLRGCTSPCDECPAMEVFRTGLPQQREWALPDGKFYQIYEYPFRDIDNSPAVLGLGIDITDRKIAELELINTRNELEDRVRQRTAELTGANEMLRVEISGRKRAQESLQESEKELHHLSSQLLNAQDEERKRIAMELHDSLGSSLSAIKFRMESALSEIGASMGGSALDKLRSTLELLQASIGEVRRIHSDIWPSVLSDLGLIMALNYHCRKFEENFPQIRIEKTFSIEEDEIPDSLKIVIYRIVQEALNNIAKHSGADSVRVALRKESGSINLAVEDNGTGFDPSKIQIERRNTAGVGLSSMRERTRLSGGIFSLESSGKGVIIRSSWREENIR